MEETSKSKLPLILAGLGCLLIGLPAMVIMLAVAIMFLGGAVASWDMNTAQLSLDPGPANVVQVVSDARV